MRYIYMDEAGTSVGEPVSVVVGVVVHGDTQWKPMDQHLRQVKEMCIPIEHRAGFVVHGKDILAGKKAPFFDDKEKWPVSRRMKIIEDVLSYRAVSGFSVCIGYHFCKNKQNDNKAEAHLRHILSYCMCLIACDAFMQSFARDEVATVVAEDLPEKRAVLKQIHSRIVALDTDFPAFRENLPIRHIVDDVHFADPKRSSLLQFADAYAFSFRRIFSGYSYADKLKKAIEGPLGMVGDLDTPGGQCGYKIFYSSPEDVVQKQLKTAR